MSNYFATVLPIACHSNRLHLLLGEEEDGWSDFGGSVEQGETFPEAASREAYEESMGLLGSPNSIRQRLMAGVRRGNRGWTGILPIPYSESLVTHFNQTAEYLRTCSYASQNGCLEKKRIAWFPLQQLLKTRSGIPLRFPMDDILPQLINLPLK